VSNDGRLQRRIQRYGWDLAVADYDRAWVPLLTEYSHGCVERASIGPGERVIDVATGTGTAAFLAAKRTGPAGRVLGVDISERMVALAGARARAAGLPWLGFERHDMETTGQPDGSFDVALCAFGLMYAAERRAALAELHRILRPGGRLVVCVWGRRTACGFREVFPIVDRRVESDVCPLFFSLGAPGALFAALREAGFSSAREEHRSLVLSWSSPEETCAAIFAGGPVALAYSKFPAAVRAEVHAEYLESLAPHRAGQGYRVPAEFVYGVAVK
jgi:ubiquinone/menaquinone biosynthesis C-methylase UbiE